MKNETRLYNVILPIWLLLLFPQLLIFVIPGNLLVDCAVLFLCLLALKHAQKKAVMKKLWWKFWLLGFAADAAGILWLFVGAFGSEYVLGDAFNDTMRYLFHNPFGHFSAFLWTLAGVAIAGACIYFFDKRAMRSCELLTGREKHIIALSMAIATAPWLFFIPTYL